MSLSRYTNSNPFFAPGFDDFFFSPVSIFRSPLDDLMPQMNEASGLLRASPGYSIHEHDGAYQISVELPGVRASDMKIEVEGDGKLLHLSGGRKVVKEGSVAETKFDKKFTIGDNVDITKMTANLADGLLILKAPKKEKEEPKTVAISITENPHPVEKQDEKKE